MSRPSDEFQAGKEATRILEKALSGKRASVARRGQAAKNIARAIWRRWKIGPWQWKLKHVAWYLTHEIIDLSPSAKYDKWRAVRTVLAGIGREDLIPWLENRRDNSYINVSGKPGARGSGGRRPYLPKRYRRLTDDGGK